ncbi:hypothetical protein KY290_021324 [Solanum tuberosum]|uniref:Uncharacterized protein n=1 Tax=Solanum tuberosum TaxID=4113 RepID=A0ABQ7V1A8_SOLTU|nr:hypothetical protein KY289_020479 [Solanum tuberosum]KAH0693149.1 hypothetical protein KY285_020246 [Solanum tuberosum]KAH0757831.1 hypothetical protein KY290_021324 [Solanum tuberosum]
MKNGRLRRGKLTGQFNIAWTDQNLLRKHCSSNKLITQHVRHENTHIDHSLDHRAPSTPLSITFRISSKFQTSLRLMLQVRSKNGGLATWEPAGASEHLELLNPTEFFADIVIEHE